MAYGERVAGERPELAATVRLLTRQYAQLRYGHVQLRRAAALATLRPCGCASSAARVLPSGTRDSNHAPMTKNSVSTTIDSR